MSQENSLWLGNHRYELDWLLCWVFTQRLGLAGVRFSFKIFFLHSNFHIQGSKIVGKQSLRALPIVGWCWYYTESIFLRRVLSADKAILERDVRRLVHDYPENYYFTVRITSIEQS